MTALALLAASVSVPATVLAQTAATAAAADKLEEVVVTARRASESLQNVPVSVQVVSADTLQKLGVSSVEEVSKLAPGLTLVNAGASATVVLRGITWQPGSGTPATPIYFNEAPFDPQQTIVSMFDMGQVEVLRGPQGTSRGAPSISGAVTMTTQRPNLRTMGGYVQGSYGSASHSDLQAAFNFPIIPSELAVRLAANIEDSEGNRIYSVKNSEKPSVKDRSYRLTALWQPTDALSFQAMYQQRKTVSHTFSQVTGAGSPGFAGNAASPAIPANFNGPALSVADRASVQDLPTDFPEHMDLLTFNASWEVLGHKLSYNFGDMFNRQRSSGYFLNRDFLNILPGFENFQQVRNTGLPGFNTREIRLSSLPSPDRRFDYDIGWYSLHRGSSGLAISQPAYLTGAFGHPVTAAPGAVTTPDSRYVLNNTTLFQLKEEFDSYYGNLRFHLTDRDELSVGVASVKDKIPVILDTKTYAASIAIANPALPSRAACPAIPGAIASPVYTSGVVCELAIPNGASNVYQSFDNSYSKTLYNFSLSHKFTDDLLTYVTGGSSFRSGLPPTGNTGLPTNLLAPDPETAKSYEVGVKSSIGRNLRINVAAFQIDYKNKLTSFEGVQYFNSVTGGISQSGVSFYRNIDAKVQGLELEIAAKPIDQLTLGANLSYSKIKSKGGRVPCTDPTQPAISAANPINYCASAAGEVLNTQAPFQAAFSGGYEIPLANAMTGYVRFNANYQGNNPNYGNFKTGSISLGTPSYAVVDLFAGVSEQKGSWDIGLYAKNVFDKQVELARVKTINSVYTNFRAPGGYDVVRTSLPREFGVKLRYAFGSR